MGDIVLSEQSVALNEVVVAGKNITQKVDRMVIIPTSAALKSAYSPYDLMLNLTIPRLRGNSINKSLEANGGGVQTRINGIVATQAEVAAILPKEIVRIEFIENPAELIVYKESLHLYAECFAQFIPTNACNWA